MLQNLGMDVLGELVDNCDYETIKNLSRVNRDMRDKLSEEKFQSTIQEKKDEKKAKHVRQRIFKMVNDVFPEECEMDYNRPSEEIKCWKSEEDEISTEETIYYKPEEISRRYYIDGKEVTKKEMIRLTWDGDSDEEFNSECSFSSEERGGECMEKKSHTVKEFMNKFEKEFGNVYYIMLRNFGSKKVFRAKLNKLYPDLMRCEGIEFDICYVYFDGDDDDDDDDDEEESFFKFSNYRYFYYKYKKEIPENMTQEEIDTFISDKHDNVTREEEDIIDEYMNIISIGLHEYKKPFKMERKRLKMYINFDEVIKSYH